MKRFTLFLFISLLLFTLIFIITFTMVIQSSPLVKQREFLNATSAYQSNVLLKRTLMLIKTSEVSGKPLFLTFTEKELKSLTGLLHRTVPRLSSDVNINDNSLMLNVSYEMLLPLDKRFINIKIKLLPSLKFMWLDDIQFGSLSVKSDWVIKLLVWVINTQVKEELGDNIFAAIKSVRFSSNRVALEVELPKTLNVQNEDKYLALKNFRDKLALFGDVDKIRAYYEAIFDFSSQLSTDKSLSRYIAFVFTQALRQTSTLENTSAVIENRAALTALALFFGPEKFMLLVGDMPPMTSNEKTRRRLLQGSTTLYKRVDLQKHYIYSVILQLIGNQESSDAIGEMKEFLDSNKGGSGFSFVDLLADRAGIRLVLAATSSEEKALYIQDLMLNAFTEQAMLPPITDFPENISKAQFEKVYGSVNSPAYKDLISEMDRRLYQLNLYR